jgi:transposase-like protein
MNVRIWSFEEEAELLTKYVEQEQSIKEIAEFFGKNERSIISKLVQLKAYKKPEEREKPAKRSVKNLLAELEELLHIELDGINLSKKRNLEIIVDALKEKFGESTT